MRYGYFDDQNREYVIERPDTPRSWSNYLGSKRYGAIITNNAGGYSFFQSAAQGRFTRLRFNAIPMDQPGRYLYIHDTESADFWSASWQPVGKDLKNYKSTCRHGSAYSVISSRYAGIETETTYFVPLDKDYECWWTKIENKDLKKRKLRLFTYVEYACNWNAADDMINLQYTQYIAKMDVVDGIISHGSNVHLPEMPDNFEEKDQGRYTFMGIAGAKITGFDTDRETFIGPYRSYANPLVVEKGKTTGSLAVGDNPCGCLEIGVELEPGEQKEFVVVMGIGKAGQEGKKAVEELSEKGHVNKLFNELRKYWHKRIDGFSAQTPDREFNSMINMWNPFNSLITFTWSRAASLVYAGERDGLGYRDTVQDFMGATQLIPEEVGERLELMLTGQVSNGGALPIVKQFSHNPGKEKKPSEEEYRSDDCLWLFDSVQTYVKETGDTEFYHKVLPYADEGEAKVIEHLRKAIEFNLERSGSHGLPCGLKADWNDCLELGHKGESVFVAMQLRHALKIYIEINEFVNDPAEVRWAEEKIKEFDEIIDASAWDGNWYKRAFRWDGLPFGSSESEEGRIFMNPQTWSVISGHASGEKAQMAMNAVKELLDTDYGIMVCAPPYDKTDFRVIRATLMNKGMKENGGIFNHTQGWAVMAETMLGNGNQSWKYFKSFLPASYNDKAELRQIEPYVYSQSTHSKYSPRYGNSRVSWLSGTATWAYYAASHYILGIRPGYEGLIIDPCIPAEWKEFSVNRVIRGKEVKIKFHNHEGSQKGVKNIQLNGTQLENNVLPYKKLKKENEVEVWM
ncbi:MAG: GH36-type glycosyl hydrolase domain-containing protein [Bacteroidales bacterium]